MFTIADIVAIVLGVASLAGTFVSHYFYIREQLHKSVGGVIDSAESIFTEGKEKFDFAVERLMTLVPMLFRPFIRRAWVECLVQFAFNKIENYAKKQIDKKDNKKNS
ncbi:MAG: hypothetical protein FWD58_05545 [Firmicutes bacterium]|nr:hypothetical protein [Bacillota bacterium]